MRTRLLLPLSILALSGHLCASQAYRCADDAGNVTIGFIPCPVQVTIEVTEDLTLEQRLTEIASLDTEINRLRSQFRDLRLSLKSRLDDDLNTRVAQALRDEYQTQTAELLDVLTELRESRSKLLTDDVKLAITEQNT